MARFDYNAAGNDELGPLTNSLSSAIRWRYSDYGAILKTELEMLAQMPPRGVPVRRPELPRAADR